MLYWEMSNNKQGHIKKISKVRLSATGDARTEGPTAQLEVPTAQLEVPLAIHSF